MPLKAKEGRGRGGGGSTGGRGKEKRKHVDKIRWVVRDNGTESNIF